MPVLEHAACISISVLSSEERDTAAKIVDRSGKGRELLNVNILI